MRERIYSFLVLAMVALFASCEDVVFDCDYTVTAYVEAREKGDKVATEGVVMHAFYADTAMWEVKSYADALAGKLTGKRANVGATKMADFTAISGTDGSVLFSSLNQEDVMIIACEESSKRYGWRVAEVYKGLEVVNISITFELWKRDNVYAQGRWVMVDEFASSRPEQYIIKSYDEEVEGGEKTPRAGVTTHIFYADSAMWEVKSYADALAGKLTKIGGSEEMWAEITVLSDTEGNGEVYVTEKPMMIVSCDEDKRYGWVFVTEETDWNSIAIIFSLWRRDAAYTQSEWRMFDDGAAERPEQTPEP